MARTMRWARLGALSLLLSGVVSCPIGELVGGKKEGRKGRLAMFIGVDISGSFMAGGYFKDSLRFLAHYIYAHLNGHGKLEVPAVLFVGSIGGAKANEPKTFFPIQTFEHKSINQIEAKLKSIFPRSVRNPFTDYNAFFEHVAMFVKDKNLVLRPISIVMITDGIPDAPKTKGMAEYRTIKLEPLENLSRNITLRVLYTGPVVGRNWKNYIPRRRVRIWTQDAQVMRDWKDRKILQPGKKFPDQDRFFSWLKDNVDFKVRIQRVK